MSRRLIDNKNIKKIIKSTKEFTFRAHGITMLRMAYGLTGILALLILSIQALTGVIQADLTKATIDNLAFAVMFIAAAITALTTLFMLLILKLQKIIKISEFQNMVFSSALRDKCDYCIILTSNKDIIYMDEKAQKLFNANNPTQYKNFSITKIIDDSSTEIQNNFYEAIANQKAFKLSHTVQDNQFIASLEPVDSIKGFLLLRASRSV